LNISIPPKIRVGAISNLEGNDSTRYDDLMFLKSADSMTVNSSMLMVGAESTDQATEGFKMIITAIETLPLRIPFKGTTKSDASAWGEVTTDEGLEGWGEAFGFVRSLLLSSRSTN
jgi:hypothetical protein